MGYSRPRKVQVTTLSYYSYSFRSITRSYYRNAVGVLLIFDITSHETFDHITDWYSDAASNTKCPSATFVLCGQKADLDSRREVCLHPMQRVSFTGVVRPALKFSKLYRYQLSKRKPWHRLLGFHTSRPLPCQEPTSNRCFISSPSQCIITWRPAPTQMYVHSCHCVFGRHSQVCIFLDFLSFLICMSRWWLILFATCAQRLERLLAVGLFWIRFTTGAVVPQRSY